MRFGTFYINENQVNLQIKLLQNFIKDPLDKDPIELHEAYALLKKFTREKEK